MRAQASRWASFQRPGQPGVMRASGERALAAEEYRAAVNADPDFAPAREELLNCLLEVCDWDGGDKVAADLRTLIARDADKEWMRYVSPLTEETTKALFVALLIARRRIGFLVDAAVVRQALETLADRQLAQIGSVDVVTGSQHHIAISKSEEWRKSILKSIIGTQQ